MFIHAQIHDNYCNSGNYALSEKTFMSPINKQIQYRSNYHILDTLYNINPHGIKTQGL